MHFSYFLKIAAKLLQKLHICKYSRLFLQIKYNFIYLARIDSGYARIRRYIFGLNRDKPIGFCKKRLALAYVRQDANVNSEGTRPKEGRVLRRGRGVPKLQKKKSTYTKKTRYIFTFHSFFRSSFQNFFRIVSPNRSATSRVHIG